MFAKIAIPRPLHTLFDYSYSEIEFPELKIGDLVLVPFGRTKVVGCVVESGLKEKTTAEGITVKAIVSRLDSEFSISNEVFQICKFGAEYFQHPIGEALFAAYPPNPQKKLNTRGSAKKSLTPAIDRGLGIHRKLNEEQVQAVEKIETEINQKKNSVFLLEGVTGSGKTEVYIEMAKKILARGQSVLILVPEIALTAQLKDRFESALGSKIALWHSALAEGLRQTQWRKVKSGEIKVIVGARSGIFAPLKNLGLIVIDEEHDATYKQEERFRYQARDLALYRAKLADCAVILGSATPSLESIHKVREGRYVHLLLKSRFSARALPEIRPISLLDEPLVMHESVKTLFAIKTIDTLQAVIDRGEQAMIYLNRRGFSQFIVCQDCGWIKKCNSCSISMTHYQRRNELRCHVCGIKETVPAACEKCHSHQLMGMGSGTEALEDELMLLLKGAVILRLDRDMVTSQGRLEKTLDDFRDLKANVLIGTQMLVKGHDFPKVTCVVIILADMLLKWPDFRAAERALQTLVQVAGRAGRAELPGQVLVQGYDLEHPVIQVLKGEFSQEQFINDELELRQLLLYPPFSRFVRYRFESEDLNSLKKKAEKMVSYLKTEFSEDQQTRILGPSEALLLKVKDRFRYDVYFKAKSVDELFKVSQRVKKMAVLEEIHLTVDVDPYSA